MSDTKVEDFLKKVEEDQALQAELAKALEAGNEREAVTALANSKGYDFSSDELWAGIQKRQAEFSQHEAAGELSDEELEAVAGGDLGDVVGTIQFTIETVNQTIKIGKEW